MWMVDVMDGCVVMDGWMSVSLRWMNVCVCGGGDR